MFVLVVILELISDTKTSNGWSYDSTRRDRIMFATDLRRLYTAQQSWQTHWPRAVSTYI